MTSGTLSTTVKTSHPIIAALVFVPLLWTGCQSDDHATNQTNEKQASRQSATSTEESSPSGGGRLGPGPYEYERSIGTKGTEPGQFREPVGLAVDPKGNLYVPDTHNRRLQKLAPSGESMAVWAEGIERPMHHAFGRDGRLLVPVFQKDEIRVFDGPGEPVASFGGPWLDAPAGVAQGPDGKFYVADFYNHRFHVVSEEGERLKTVGYDDGLQVVSEGGDKLEEVGQKGKDAPGQFTYPTDVAVEHDGTIWIADAYAHRVQVFSSDLEHERTIGGWGKREPGKFRVATGIDVGPEGKLYVADFNNHRVQVLQPDGTPVALVEGQEEGDGSLKLPTEVVRTQTKLYVTDHGHHQIDVYGIDGTNSREE